MITNLIIGYGTKKDEVNMGHVRMYVVCFTCLILLLLIVFGVFWHYKH